MSSSNVKCARVQRGLPGAEVPLALRYTESSSAVVTWSVPREIRDIGRAGYTAARGVTARRDGCEGTREGDPAPCQAPTPPAEMRRRARSRSYWTARCSRCEPDSPCLHRFVLSGNVSPRSASTLRVWPAFAVQPLPLSQGAHEPDRVCASSSTARSSSPPFSPPSLITRARAPSWSATVVTLDRGLLDYHGVVCDVTRPQHVRLG